MHLLGYCPRFLRGEVRRLMGHGGGTPELTVLRVNPSPAPAQFRLLCELRMPWPEGFEPFNAPEFRPLVKAELRAA